MSCILIKKAKTSLKRRDIHIWARKKDRKRGSCIPRPTQQLLAGLPTGSPAHQQLPGLALFGAAAVATFVKATRRLNMLRHPVCNFKPKLNYRVIVVALQPPAQGKVSCIEPAFFLFSLLCFYVFFPFLFPFLLALHTVPLSHKSFPAAYFMRRLFTCSLSCGMFGFIISLFICYVTSFITYNGID